MNYLVILGSTGSIGRQCLAVVESLPAQFVVCGLAAGSNLDEALKAVAAMRRRSLTFTVDLLGEATVTEAEAEQYQGEYLHLIDGLSKQVNSWPEVERIDRDCYGPLPRVNVSVKLSSLFSQFDPIDPEGTGRVVRERLRPILRAAQRAGRA